MQRTSTLSLLTFALATACMLSPLNVRAQTQTDVPQASEAQETATDITSETTSEDTAKHQIKLNDLYVKPTYENLLKLYWRNSKLDIKSTRDLDLYLMTSECEITKKYRQNDFEWQDIRNATQKFILGNKSKFPNQFRFVQPIEFGEYDFGREGFSILPDFQYKGLKFVRISNNAPDERNCSARIMLGENPSGFAPYNVAVQLDLPFSLTYVPMNKELSKRYLDYISKMTKKNMAAADRVAYVTFYLTLGGYIKTTRDGTTQTSDIAVYSGTIDYISISADQNGKYPLYFRTIRND